MAGTGRDGIGNNAGVFCDWAAVALAGSSENGKIRANVLLI